MGIVYSLWTYKHYLLKLCLGKPQNFNKLQIKNNTKRAIKRVLFRIAVSFLSPRKRIKFSAVPSKPEKIG